MDGDDAVDTVKFTCAGCGKKYSAPATKAGSTAKCAACGAPLRVPGTGLAAAPPGPIPPRVGDRRGGQDRRGPEAAAPASSRCPSCTKPIRETDVECPKCGEQLFQLCPLCSEPVRVPVRRCPSCGARLQSPRRSQVVPWTWSWSAWWGIMYGPIPVGGIVVVLGYVLYHLATDGRVAR